MKDLLKNRKGFTLIELLAVIVILAILVMVAIPAVTKYLNTARAGTFVDNAKSAISAVRNDVVINGTEKTTYELADINALLEKKMVNSPFGSRYCSDSKIVATVNDKDGTTTYKIMLYDTAGHGWQSEIEENLLSTEDVVINGKTPDKCTAIKDDGTASGTSVTRVCYINGKISEKYTSENACKSNGGQWLKSE